MKGGIVQHTTALAHRLARDGAHVTLYSWGRPFPEILYPAAQPSRLGGNQRHAQEPAARSRATVEEPELPPFEAVDRRLAWNRPETWWAAGRQASGCDLAVFTLFLPVQAIPYGVAIQAIGPDRDIAVICHNVLPHEPHPGDAWLVGRLLRRADRVLVHSADQATIAESLTPSPVVSATLPPHLPTAFACRRPEPGVHRRLLFFGHIRPYKGLDVLLEALAAGPPGVELRVAGEVWGGTAALEAQLKRLGLGDRVEFRSGYIPAGEVPALFADVDALVMPYREATGSQGVGVGFQFGVPVIVTRTGELSDAVRDGVDGLVAEAADPTSLAAALERFYEPGVALAMREKVRPVDPGPLWDRYLEQLTPPVRRMEWRRATG